MTRTQISHPPKIVSKSTVRIYTLIRQNWLDNYNDNEPEREKIVGYRIPIKDAKKLARDGWKLDKAILGINASRWASGLEHKKRRDILEFTISLLEQGGLPKIWIQEHQETTNEYGSWVGTDYDIRTIEIPKEEAEKLRHKMIFEIKQLLEELEQNQRNIVKKIDP